MGAGWVALGGWRGGRHKSHTVSQKQGALNFEKDNTDRIFSPSFWGPKWVGLDYFGMDLGCLGLAWRHGWVDGWRDE